jgi:hypothetical protein
MAEEVWLRWPPDAELGNEMIATHSARIKSVVMSPGAAELLVNGTAAEPGITVQPGDRLTFAVLRQELMQVCG